MKVSAVLPVRIESRRVPGKPLVDIGGSPLLFHVWSGLAASQYAGEIIVVTDSRRVEQIVSSWGGSVILSEEARSGTERIATITDRLRYEHVVNIQCDQLGFGADQLDQFARYWDTVDAELLTPVYAGAARSDAATVKAIIDDTGLATDFRRELKDTSQEAWGHIGVYGYTKTMLDRYREFEPSSREVSESLEQLRFTDNGLAFQTYDAGRPSTPINTPDELERARLAFLAQRG